MDTFQNENIGLLGLTSIILGIILVYFVISLIRHQRRNLKLNQEKVAAEIATLENERRRMAADLHDEIGPTLSGIKLLISSFSPKDEKEKELLARVNGHINQTIQRMREISNNLMPRVLEKRGIKEAMEMLFEENMRIHPLEIRFRYQVDKKLDLNQKLHLYRIVQEILHNTVKHAKANVLEVSLYSNGKRVFFETKDDGTGFQFQGELRKASGLGLRNLLSRSEILNGNIYLDSSPSKGTKITLNFPIK
jgi:two-component system, NarL family, sensor kinase